MSCHRRMDPILHNLRVLHEKYTSELAELRAMMERSPAHRRRLEFRAAELAVRAELIEERLRDREAAAFNAQRTSVPR
jgi:hypothetical protein